MSQDERALPEFLLARIAEDEEVARSAEGGPLGVYSGTWWGQPAARPLPVSTDDAAHIARHDPARVLSECAAKRRIVELHRGVEGDCPTCSDSGWAGAVDGHTGVSVPCPTLRALASVYADHPDYPGR